MPKLIGVAGRDFPGDFGAFFQITADGEISRRGAATVGLLEAAVAAVEAGDDTGPAFSWRCFRLDERLHFVAPFLPLFGAAKAAQIVQSAKNFRQPLQIAVEWRCAAFHCARRGTGYSQKKRQQD